MTVYTALDYSSLCDDSTVYEKDTTFDPADYSSSNDGSTESESEEEEEGEDESDDSRERR